MNFMGHNVWVAGGDGFEGVTVAERDEPPAIIGSHLQKLAYPEAYKKHVARGMELEHAHHHPGENVLDVQQRGEYIYAALGEGGFRVYDISNIDNKDFSERIVTAPVSPFGQRLYVKTKYATAVATPTTLGVDPLRKQYPENEEQKIHLVYGFLYVADRDEGLVIVADAARRQPVEQLSSGRRPSILAASSPARSHHRRQLRLHPDAEEPRRRLARRSVPPRSSTLGEADGLRDPRGVQIQFRYGFLADKDGLKVPMDGARQAARREGRPRAVQGRAQRVSRPTYALVAAGSDGRYRRHRSLKPSLERMRRRGAHQRHQRREDRHANASQFAYVADGRNGLQVVQLFSPSDNPNYLGFSPHSRCASRSSMRDARVVSEGIDHDRAADESGTSWSKPAPRVRYEGGDGQAVHARRPGLHRDEHAGPPSTAVRYRRRRDARRCGSAFQLGSFTAWLAV
jgi:hypothetical protein